MFTKQTLAALAGSAVIAAGTQAAPLLIDFSTGASSTAASPALTDWETFGGTSATATQNKAFSGYTDLAAGDISVKVSGIGFNRLYKNGFTGVADDFPGTDLDVMYSDMLFRNNAGTPIDITISGLAAGTYQITTHHLVQDVTPQTEFDLLVQDADSPAFGQNVGNFAMGRGSTSSFLPTVITFNVESNGTDDVILRMAVTNLAGGGNTGGWWGINGMEIAVPEPSSLALLGLGGLLVARRRRG